MTCLSVHTGSKSKLLLPVRVSNEEVNKRDSQLGEFESSDACKRFTLPVEWRRKPQKARYVREIHSELAEIHVEKRNLINERALNREPAPLMLPMLDQSTVVR